MPAGKGRPMKNVVRHRRLPVICGLAVALFAPLVGCGAAGGGSEASGDKAGGSSSADPVVLRMLNPAAGQLSQNFVNEVDRLSNGRIKIEAIALWHFDDPNLRATRNQDIFDAVRAGEAPLGLGGASQFHDQGIGSFDALVAPMLIDSADLQTAVLHSSIATDMLNDLGGTGLDGVGILPGPISYPWGAGRHLLDVSDYQGASFIGPLRPVSKRSIEALGGTFRSPTSEEDRNSAPIDGFVVPAVEWAGGPREATSVTTNVTFGPLALVIFGNADALAALSEQDRSILRDAATSAGEIQTGTDYTNEAGSVLGLCRSGEVAFERASPAQVDALRAELEPVFQWLREDPATSGFIDRIQQLSESMPADPGTASAIECPQSTQNPSEPAAATPIDGMYSMTTTLEELKASGAPPDHWLSENWGEMNYVFDRGRFAFTQHNDEACTWAYGRYTIDGDILTVDFDDGGGSAPNDAAMRAGEHFGFGWSLYRDVLTLSPKEGQPSPLVSGHTWPLQRMTATPDVSALNQECPPPPQAFPR